MNGRDVGVDGEAQTVDVERRLLVDELIGRGFKRAVAQTPAVERRESPVPAASVRSKPEPWPGAAARSTKNGPKLEVARCTVPSSGWNR